MEENNKKSPNTRTNLFKILGKFTAFSNCLFENGRYLSFEAKWLLCTLRSFQNQNTGLIFPSYDAIQRKGGFSRGSVSRALNELKTFGWLETERRPGKRSKTPNYRLLYPENLSPTAEQKAEWKKSLKLKKKRNFELIIEWKKNKKDEK